MNSNANIGSVQHAEAELFDVIIIGAGLSGIGAAVRLQRDCPDRTFAVLERRGAIGGTWDLFRYPGIAQIATCTRWDMTSSHGKQKNPSLMAPQSSVI